MIYHHSKSGIDFIDIKNFEFGPNGGQYPVVSLFTGAGGLDIGLEEAGFSTRICVENDINCRATLKHNRKDWVLFEKGWKEVDNTIINREPGDIRNIEVDEVLESSSLKPGEAALVVGGAPCQPFSNIGKKQGKEDTKNGDLFLEFVRFVKGVNPKAFIFENVTGITQNRHSEVVAYMLEKLSGLGYSISHTVLNSANYGVPQLRERFFLVGIKGSQKPAFPLPTHYRNLELWNTFISGFDKKASYFPNSWVSVKEAFDQLPKDYGDRSDYVVMNISDVVKRRMEYIEQGQNFKVLPMDLRPNCWKTGKHQGHDTFGRLREDLPSVTIRTAAYNPSKGMYIHPYHNRGLDTMEMAMLQSFPTNWQFKCHNREKLTLVSGGKQIGNAVPPNLARAIGAAIKLQLITSSSVSEKKHDLLAEVS